MTELVADIPWVTYKAIMHSWLDKQGKQEAELDRSLCWY